MTRILFVGQMWQGSSARSMREALSQRAGVFVQEVAEDHFIPSHKQLPLRIVNKALHRLHLRELENAVLAGLEDFAPDALLVYKGFGVDASFIKKVRASGIPVINMFPDCSPHAHGRQLREAMGTYDLVISTKPFHPKLWQPVYGYQNSCVHVSHGYDPLVHEWAEPPTATEYDVALCANWRQEYHQLMLDLAKALGSEKIHVVIAGPGWTERQAEFPQHWQCVGPKSGPSYGEFLRASKIAIAPVTRQLVVNGVAQPGDEDTTRTYELASAYCFFLHQRTEYVGTIYDEQREVPLWTDATELAALVRRWLPDETGRREMAARAHARAVPAYSIPERAAAVLRHIRAVIEQPRQARA